LRGSDGGARQAIGSHLRAGGHLTLFLDYDGTLVPIAPTPAEALPDAPLIELLNRLARSPAIRTLILSGRPLEQLQEMLPIKGLLFGGLYGVEMQVGENRVARDPPKDGSRKSLTQIRDGWSRLTNGAKGFLVEDKGLAVALHARWAEAEQARRVMEAARSLATDLIDPRAYRILDGDRFLEIAPATADKGDTVDWLLSQYPIPRDLPVAFGDDNKDEAAFAAVQRRGGYAIGVGHRYPLPEADERLESPEEVRLWLRELIEEPSLGEFRS
jgi:trehalose 6-phosphate phosphatase